MEDPRAAVHARLRHFAHRDMALREEQRLLNKSKREWARDARAEGFDSAAIQRAVTEHRKPRDRRDATLPADSLAATYLAVLDEGDPAP